MALSAAAACSFHNQARALQRRPDEASEALCCRALVDARQSDPSDIEPSARKPKAAAPPQEAPRRGETWHLQVATAFRPGREAGPSSGPFFRATVVSAALLGAGPPECDRPPPKACRRPPPAFPAAAARPAPLCNRPNTRGRRPDAASRKLPGPQMCFTADHATGSRAFCGRASRERRHHTQIGHCDAATPANEHALPQRTSLRGLNRGAYRTSGRPKPAGRRCRIPPRSHPQRP
jgi:hypothetical protein